MTDFIEIKDLDLKEKSTRQLLLNAYACLQEVEDRLEDSSEEMNEFTSKVEDCANSVHDLITEELNFNTDDLLGLDISFSELETGLSDSDWFDMMFGDCKKDG